MIRGDIQGVGQDPRLTKSIFTVTRILISIEVFVLNLTHVIYSLEYLVLLHYGVGRMH